jgi:phosphotransferase system enzyme I (PtsI)
MNKEDNILTGIPASPGIAIAPAFCISDGELIIPEYGIKAADVAQEKKRFRNAITATREQISKIREEVSTTIGEDEARIFDTHVLMLKDSATFEETLKRIEDTRKNAEYLFNEVMDVQIRIFEQHEDDYFRNRIIDLEDVRNRVLRNLIPESASSKLYLPRKVIIVSSNLTPSQSAALDRTRVLGFVTDLGGSTSHTAIMARSMEIPAVVGLGDITKRMRNRRSGSSPLLIVDGNKGKVYIDPTPSQMEDYRKKSRKYTRFLKSLERYKELTAVTTDGRSVELSANIEFPEDANSISKFGARGIGLLRTEYFYLTSPELPGEESLYRNFMDIATRVYPDPLIIRTLDVGGDKKLASIDIPEELNPFLGWRAVRYCFSNPGVFKAQLRAILGATSLGNVKIMFPMISGLQEVLRAKEILAECREELMEKEIEFDRECPVGIMVEIPSAVAIADVLADHVDFFSIGTNDLIQYTLAVDRGNEKIAHLYDPGHPAVLRMIKQIADTGMEKGKWVGVCGEMAGDPLYIPLLLGFGVDELSTNLHVVPEAKRIIRSLSYEECRQIAAEALRFTTGDDVNRYMLQVIQEKLPWLETWVRENSVRKNAAP